MDSYDKLTPFGIGPNGIDGCAVSEPGVDQHFFMCFKTPALVGFPQYI